MERWDPENRTHDRFVIDRVTASSNMLTLKDRDGVRLDLKVSAVDSQWTLFRAETLPVAEGERLAVLGKIPDTRLKGGESITVMKVEEGQLTVQRPGQKTTQTLAVGAGVVVSQFLGAKDHREAQEAVHTSLAIAVIMGLLLTVGGVACGRALLVAMNTPAEVLGDAVTYIRIYFGGVLFSVVYNMTAGILNAAGNSRRSLIYLAWASVTNIVLDLVFIVIFRMGVAGAAIATDISQLVSCVLSLRFLIKSTDDCRVIPREIRLHKKMAARIIRVGLPTGIQNMVISFSNVLVQASVNSYGAAAMAGFAAYMKIDGFNILPVSSISMAATTFVGQNYGAGRLDRVKKGTWVTLAMGLVYTLATGALLLLGQDAIMHLFTNDETVVFFGEAAMHWFCPFYFLLSILHGLAGAVRGTGASVPPMVVLLVSLCLFRIVWIQWVLPLFSGIEGVFILYPVSWALGAGLMILYAWKGKWMEYHA